MLSPHPRNPKMSDSSPLSHLLDLLTSDRPIHKARPQVPGIFETIRCQGLVIVADFGLESKVFPPQSDADWLTAPSSIIADFLASLSP